MHAMETDATAAAAACSSSGHKGPGRGAKPPPALAPCATAAGNAANHAGASRTETLAGCTADRSGIHGVVEAACENRFVGPGRFGPSYPALSTKIPWARMTSWLAGGALS